jgi:hypothetical protein
MSDSHVTDIRRLDWGAAHVAQRTGGSGRHEGQHRVRAPDAA